MAQAVPQKRIAVTARTCAVLTSPSIGTYSSIVWAMLGPPGGNRCTSRGYVRSTYSHHEIDLAGVYSGELDRCFLLPIAICAGRHGVQLRLTPARNNQRACINLADDFAFEGAVAQLARAPEWHSGGRGFESPQLHSSQERSHEPTTIGSELFGKQITVTFRGRPRVRLVPINPPLLQVA